MIGCAGRIEHASRLRENQTSAIDVAVIMNVDLIITELNVGGAEKALTRLAIGLTKRDHSVRVLSIGSEPKEEHHALVDQLRSAEIPIAFGDCDSARQFLQARRWLHKQFKRHPADIRQSFLFHANCLTAAAALGRVSSDSSGPVPLVGGIRVAEHRPLRCKLESIALKRMSHVVCVSEAVRSFSERDMRVSPDRLSVIPNGIEIDDRGHQARFEWSTIGLPSDSRVILFVGRLHPQKGLELLQQQITSIVASDPRTRLVLIGQGPLKSDLETWIQNLPDDRVRLLPFQTDLRPFYAACEVLVLPSHYEGMPNVILEAMAMEKAVVCSRIEGTAELFPPVPSAATQTAGIPEGISDVPQDSIDLQRRQYQTFERGDGDAMSARLLDLLRDDSLRESFGQANRRYVERFFTVETMVDRYETLYASLVRGVRQ